MSKSGELVDAGVFEEIKDCIYRDVGGFFSEYSEGETGLRRRR
jgi:hypothetical protein